MGRINCRAKTTNSFIVDIVHFLLVCYIISVLVHTIKIVSEEEQDEYANCTDNYYYKPYDPRPFLMRFVIRFWIVVLK